MEKSGFSSRFLSEIPRFAIIPLDCTSLGLSSTVLDHVIFVVAFGTLHEITEMGL